MNRTAKPKKSAASKVKRQVAFRPRARLLRMLGEELISDHVIAIVELVKNAYDADASEVTVRLNLTDRDPSVQITDDGHGMTRRDVEGAWMEPGGSTKRTLRNSPNGRVLLGKKGVGRFAADKLASQLEMRTKCEGARTELVAKFDWGRFDEAEKYLDEILFSLVEQPAPDRRAHGTTLLLSPLRSGWDDAFLERLRAELVKLQSPFLSRAADPFTIKLVRNRTKEDLAVIAGELIQFAPVHLTAQIINTDKNPSIELTLNGKELSPVAVAGGGPLDSGSFGMTLYAWKRDPASLETLKSALDMTNRKARDLLDQWCGVSIYRDGFRVYPYGQSGDDWLELDRRRINVPGGRLSNNQLIGAIHISEADNQKLLDQTNREGLMENKAFGDLKRIVQQVVQVAANHLNRDVKERRADKRPSLFERTALTTLLEKVGDKNAPLDRAELVKLAERAHAESDKTEKAVYNEITRYNRLLSLGVVASRMVHEVRQQTDLLRRTGDTVLLLVGKGKTTTDVLEPKIKAMDGSAAIIHREVTRIAPFIRARRKIEVVDPLHVLADVMEQEAPRVSKLAVTISLPSSKGAQLLVSADVGELFQVFHNLIDNSLYWLKGVKAAAIKVRAAAVGGFAQIIIEDNGPGIAEDSLEEIFEPFWTTKPEGSGLGLPIIGEILHDYGGGIELVDNRFGKGCAFQVRIPLAK